MPWQNAKNGKYLPNNPKTLDFSSEDTIPQVPVISPIHTKRIPFMVLSICFSVKF